MPTGVPIPNVRAQLFEAGMQVLMRDGAGALTSRAVTSEAGVAKGLLHRHFSDFDTFLASLVLAQIQLIDARSAELRRSAGTGDVAANVADVLAITLAPDALVLVDLVLSRRALLHRLRLATPAGIPLLAETTRMIAAYLTAERGLGRISLGADVDRFALILVGATHLLCAGRDGTPPDSEEIYGLIATTIAGIVQEPRADTSRAATADRKAQHDHDRPTRSGH
ncbi:MAG: TetR/AcrR family transcriptional regulator [Solirubrobacteraceae bacterium]